MTEIFNPKFRDMSKSNILKTVNFNSNWRPFGYTQMRYSCKTATVLIGRSVNDFKFM